MGNKGSRSAKFVAPHELQQDMVRSVSDACTALLAISGSDLKAPSDLGCKKPKMAGRSPERLSNFDMHREDQQSKVRTSLAAILLDYLHLPLKEHQSIHH